jgi:O-antigen/teichoic acid export membrane protein
MMWAYVRTGIYALVGIPTTIVLARLLSPADFGIAAAAVFFGELASRLSSGGLGVALVRTKELREDHISSVFVVNVVMSAVGALALVAAAPAIGRFYGAPEVGWLLPVVTLNFVLGALSMVQQALLARDLRYKEMATLGGLDLTVSSVTAVIFAASGLSFWSLVLGKVCGAFVKWIGGIWLVGWHVRLRFVPAAARELSSFALGIYTKGTLEHFARNVDSILIGRLLGVTALGFYDKAFSIINRVFNKMTVVGPNVSFRIFSIIQDEPERFRRAYRRVIMTVTLVGYIVLGALGAMAPQLIVVALGEKWSPSVLPFQILCFAFALKLIDQYATSASNARGWVWPQVGFKVVKVACLIGGIYLASPWGINGVAIAVLGAGVVNFLLMQTLMRRATGLGWLDVLQPQVPALVSTALLVGLLLGAAAAVHAVHAAPAVILIAQVAAAALFLLAFAWWCPFREARELMHEVVSDVSPRLARFVWRDVVTERRPARAPAAEETATLPSGGMVP